MVLSLSKVMLHQMGQYRPVDTRRRVDMNRGMTASIAVYVQKNAQGRDVPLLDDAGEVQLYSPKAGTGSNVGGYSGWRRYPFKGQLSRAARTWLDEANKKFAETGDIGEYFLQGSDRGSYPSRKYIPSTSSIQAGQISVPLEYEGPVEDVRPQTPRRRRTRGDSVEVYAPGPDLDADPPPPSDPPAPRQVETRRPASRTDDVLEAMRRGQFPQGNIEDWIETPSGNILYLDDGALEVPDGRLLQPNTPEWDELMDEDYGDVPLGDPYADPEPEPQRAQPREEPKSTQDPETKPPPDADTNARRTPDPAPVDQDTISIRDRYKSYSDTPFEEVSRSGAPGMYPQVGSAEEVADVPEPKGKLGGGRRRAVVAGAAALGGLGLGVVLDGMMRTRQKPEPVAEPRQDMAELDIDEMYQRESERIFNGILGRPREVIQSDIDSTVDDIEALRRLGDDPRTLEDIGYLDKQRIAFLRELKGSQRKWAQVPASLSDEDAIMQAWDQAQAEARVRVSDWMGVQEQPPTPEPAQREPRQRAPRPQAPTVNVPDTPADVETPRVDPGDTPSRRWFRGWKPAPVAAGAAGGLGLGYILHEMLSQRHDMAEDLPVTFPGWGDERPTNPDFIAEEFGKRQAFLDQEFNSQVRIRQLELVASTFGDDPDDLLQQADDLSDQMAEVRADVAELRNERGIRARTLPAFIAVLEEESAVTGVTDPDLPRLYEYRDSMAEMALEREGLKKQARQATGAMERIPQEAWEELRLQAVEELAPSHQASMDHVSGMQDNVMRAYQAQYEAVSAQRMPMVIDDLPGPAAADAPDAFRAGSGSVDAPAPRSRRPLAIGAAAGVGALGLAGMLAWQIRERDGERQNMAVGGGLLDDEWDEVYKYTPDAITGDALPTNPNVLDPMEYERFGVNLNNQALGPGGLQYRSGWPTAQDFPGRVAKDITDRSVPAMHLPPNPNKSILLRAQESLRRAVDQGDEFIRSTNDAIRGMNEEMLADDRRHADAMREIDLRYGKSDKRFAGVLLGATGLVAAGVYGVNHWANNLKQGLKAKARDEGRQDMAPYPEGIDPAEVEAVQRRLLAQAQAESEKGVWDRARKIGEQEEAARLKDMRGPIKDWYASIPPDQPGHLYGQIVRNPEYVALTPFVQATHSERAAVERMALEYGVTPEEIQKSEARRNRVPRKLNPQIERRKPNPQDMAYRAEGARGGDVPDRFDRETLARFWAAGKNTDEMPVTWRRLEIGPEGDRMRAALVSMERNEYVDNHARQLSNALRTLRYREGNVPLLQERLDVARANAENLAAQPRGQRAGLLALQRYLTDAEDKLAFQLLERQSSMDEVASLESSDPGALFDAERVQRNQERMMVEERFLQGQGRPAGYQPEQWELDEMADREQGQTPRQESAPRPGREVQSRIVREELERQRERGTERMKREPWELDEVRDRWASRREAGPTVMAYMPNGDEVLSDGTVRVTDVGDIPPQETASKKVLEATNNPSYIGEDIPEDVKGRTSRSRRGLIIGGAAAGTLGLAGFVASEIKRRSNNDRVPQEV